MATQTPKRKHRFARCPICLCPTRETYDGKLFKHYRYSGGATENESHCEGSGKPVTR